MGERRSRALGPGRLAAVAAAALIFAAGYVTGRRPPAPNPPAAVEAPAPPPREMDLRMPEPEPVPRRPALPEGRGMSSSNGFVETCPNVKPNALLALKLKPIDGQMRLYLRNISGKTLKGLTADITLNGVKRSWPLSLKAGEERLLTSDLVSRRGDNVLSYGVSRNGARMRDAGWLSDPNGCNPEKFAPGYYEQIREPVPGIDF